jgi:hypothetical protein
MTTCPDHPGRTGNELPGCRWCIQEAVLADATRGLADVRAALRVAPRLPTEQAAPDPIHDLALAQKRADELHARETRNG